MKYGYSDQAWQAAKTETKVVLRERASRRSDQPIAYSDLAAKIRSIQFDPQQHAYHVMLGEVSEEEDDEGRGMLSVLVVHKGGDFMPGQGFFDLASARGRNISDRLAIWALEFQAVLDANKKLTNSKG